jgi:hypothetical protein
LNFYIVYCKTRRKFDKYIKINRIRNKVIVDIRELIEQEDIDVESHRDYFNLTVYTKIVHSLKKSKDIYYIPNFRGNNVIVSEILKLKEILNFDIKFNILIFYDEFINDKELLDEVFNNINNFDSSQIIKDY